MGAALGFLLGSGLSAVAGAAHEKAKQKQTQDAALFDFYKQNPQMVKDNPEAQKFITKYAGPELTDSFNQIADLASHGAQHFQQITSGQPQPVAGAAPGTAPQAMAPEDEIRALDQFSATPEGQAFERQFPGRIDKHTTDLRQLQGQKFTTEQQARSQEFQHQQSLESQAASDKRMLESSAASDKRFNEGLAAISERQSRSEQFMGDMQTRREQQQNHIEDLRSAKTAEDRKVKMQQIIGSLGKTTSDLTAKLGKGSDYDQQQREMSAESHNQYIESLANMTDDPKQVEALQKMKINVAPAVPGRIYGETPGAVGASAVPAGTSGGPPTATNPKTGEKVVWNGSGWVPAK